MLPPSATEPLELFPWLEVLALALGRKHISQPAAAVALFIALGSKGTTGTGATVDAARLATELDLSDRQIWRHFKRLCDDAWFAQTSHPTRGEAGQKGRRARYRLTYPSVFMSDESRVTLPGAGMSDDPTREAESSDTSDPNRLTPSAESSDIAEREDGTVTPSGGSPSVGSPGGHASAPTTDREPSRPLQPSWAQCACGSCNACKAAS